MHYVPRIREIPEHTADVLCDHPALGLAIDTITDAGVALVVLTIPQPAVRALKKCYFWGDFPEPSAWDVLVLGRFPQQWASLRVRF